MKYNIIGLILMKNYYESLQNKKCKKQYYEFINYYNNKIKVKNNIFILKVI